MGNEVYVSDQPFLHVSRIEMPLEIRTYVLQLLQQTLVGTLDLRSHVKQAAWNVKGPDFALLQTLFGTLATALDAYADLLAERIAVLGGVARGTARAVALHSPLPEYPSDLVVGLAHVQALAERVAAYVTTLRGAMTHTVEVEEVGTAALYTDIARGMETRLGGLEAYLQG